MAAHEAAAWPNSILMEVDHSTETMGFFHQPYPMPLLHHEPTPELSEGRAFTHIFQNDPLLEYEITNNGAESSHAMGPPPRKRAKKAPTIRLEDWIPYKARIFELYVEKKLKLEDVQKTIREETGFDANIRQYGVRISSWKWDRNTKSQEMKAIVRKQQHRKLREPDKKPLRFEVRDRPIVPEKIERWIKSHPISDATLDVTSPDSATPSAVGCFTVSDRGTPAPSPSHFNSMPSPSPFSPRTPLEVAHFDFPTLYSSATTQLPQSAFANQNATAAVSHLRNGVDMPVEQGNTVVEIDFPFTNPYEQALSKEIEDLEVKLLEARRRILGEEHPLTLSLMNDLAVTYSKQTQHQEAEDLHVKTLEARRRILGEEHPHTLMSMYNLAVTYYSQTRYQEAEDLHVKTLEARRRILGEEHPHTLMSMYNLAVTYYSQTRYQEAEDLHVKTLEARRRILGEEHPHTLMSMHNLAVTYYSQTRYQGAEDLHVKTLEARRRILGEEYPDTLLSMKNLAATYHKQTRYQEAEDLHIKTLEARRRILGEEHPHTLMSMYNLAVTYYSQTRYQQAEDLEVKVLEICRRILGEEHPDTLMSMHNLAVTYYSQTRYQEAEDLEVKVLEICRRILGEEHPNTLLSMKNLAATYHKQTRYQEAEGLRNLAQKLRDRKSSY